MLGTRTGKAAAGTWNVLDARTAACMWTPENLVITAAAFLLAGAVKGVVGLGLPTVSLALLTAAFGLREAMALMLIPSFVTNAWQGAAGGALSGILRRLWPLLVAACLGIWLGAGLLAESDARLLSGLLGAVLCLYSAISLTPGRVPAPGARETWLSPAVGLVNGVLTGLTGSFVVPATLYLQALGLDRNVLIQAMGVLYTVSTAALGIALADKRLLPPDLVVVSTAAVLPALAGMAVGRRVRQWLSETTFRKVFFGSLLILGLYIMGRAFL